jgi:hypothetical protein
MRISEISYFSGSVIQKTGITKKRVNELNHFITTQSFYFYFFKFLVYINNNHPL